MSSPISPASISRLAVTCDATQRSGQLIAIVFPVPAIAAIIRRASAAEAANGFSTKRCAREDAIRSVMAACSAVATQRIARSAPTDRHALRSVKTRSSGMPKVSTAVCILPRSGSKMPAISAYGCSCTWRSRSPMCM